MPRETEPVLEADDGALIKPEQIAGVLAEAAPPKIAVEPVCQLEARSITRPRNPAAAKNPITVVVYVMWPV
jgi:hypothetical protein